MQGTGRGRGAREEKVAKNRGVKVGKGPMVESLGWGLMWRGVRWEVIQGPGSAVRGMIWFGAGAVGVIVVAKALGVLP